VATSKNSFADRFYGALLRLLPFDFQRDFGSDMEQAFREQRDDTARRRGRSGLLRMWWATIIDIFRMAPREHLSVLAQDVRYALRVMGRNPGFTVSAILILGLGIGVNTSIFSVVNSVLLKPLPYAQGDRLVVLRQPAVKQGSNNLAFSVQEIQDFRQQMSSMTGLVEYHGMSFTLFGGSEARRVRTGVVSAGFFDFFGIQPLLGRSFRAEDDVPGAPPVLLLSYDYWKKYEGSNPNVVGKAYKMNDRPHTVIGVLPRIPQYPNENDVYMPTVACPTRSAARVIANRDFRMMSVFGRLKPEASLEFCTRDVSTIAARLKQDYPKSYPERLGYTAAASLLRDDLIKDAKPMLLVLLGAAAFVLLIACANVANLILARMARREQELVIRTAVGAGSGRILRQLLTESLIMALLSAGIGLLFAFSSIRLLSDFASQLTPRAREISIDAWVLGFAVLCATATTVLFGSIAALYSRHDVASGLKESSRTSADRSRQALRSMLIAAQVAFSFILLIGAGLMVRSFVQLSKVDPGFVPQRVLAASINLNWSRYQNDDYRKVSERLLEKLEAMPGVTSAAVASSYPMNADRINFGGRPVRISEEGELRSEAEGVTARAVTSVTPGYFQTLGIPLVAGRSFSITDGPDAAPVAVISRSLAIKRWGNTDPIGRRVRVGNSEVWLRIVGIVGDVKDYGPDREAPAGIYLPLAQNAQPGALLIRTVAEPSQAMAALRRVIRDVDPETAVPVLETLEDARDKAVSSPRTMTSLFGLYAGLALVIAIAGIASMLALWVRQRTREIGIRMAMGASPKAILTGVIRQGMALVLVGLAIGLPRAMAVTRLLKTMLFQVEPTDAITYVAVSAVLLAAAVIACWVPARRAAGIDPQIALRCD
jgi:putative ABC transport system permease protein